MAALPSTYDGVAAVLSLLVLLTEFAMLRAPLLRSQVRLYAFQSLVVTGLATYVAASKHIDELYVLAGLSLILKGGHRSIAHPATLARCGHGSGGKFGVGTCQRHSDRTGGGGFWVLCGGIASCQFGVPAHVVLGDRVRHRAGGFRV